MLRQQHIIIFFVVLLIAFFIIFGIKSTQDEVDKKSPSKKYKTTDIAKEINELKNSQAAIKATLASLESKIRNQAPVSATTEDLTEDQSAQFSGVFITEAINRKNAGTKAKWQDTNQPNAFIISVYLENEPAPSSLLVWTGLGILPFSAYKVEGNILNIIFQQSQEVFMNANNYINIRYFPKSN